MRKKDLMGKRFEVVGRWVRKNDPEMYNVFFNIVRGTNRLITEEEFDDWKCRYRFLTGPGPYKEPMVILAAGSTAERMAFEDLHVKVSLDYVSVAQLELYTQKAVKPEKKGLAFLREWARG